MTPAFTPSRLAPLALTCLAFAPACIEDSERVADTNTPTDTVDTSDEVPPGTDASDDSGPGGEPCDEPGITRCASDAAAVELCLDQTWQRAACAEDKICVVAGGAQCVDSTGDATCRDTLYCFLGCQLLFEDLAAQDACFVDCYRTAAEDAQRELSDVIGCLDDNCMDAAGLDCVAGRCSQDLADCYFDTHGTARCGAIIECRLTCADGDEACVTACGEDATIEAQGDYAVLELCTFYACAGQDDDCARRAALPTGPCGDYANACVGLLPSTPR